MLDTLSGLNMPITKTRLAQRTGITREFVYWILPQLVDEGVVRVIRPQKRRRSTEKYIINRPC